MPDFFIVTKPIQFDARGRVISGQCLPDTDGWKVIRFDSLSGTETVVFTGFYDHCKTIQENFVRGEVALIEELARKLETEAGTRRGRKSWIFRHFTRNKDGT
ncbi:MAG: hypothetical protein WC712_00415 [Candidatus Brocadiia bacterium]